MVGERSSAHLDSRPRRTCWHTQHVQRLRLQYLPVFDYYGVTNWLRDGGKFVESARLDVPIRSLPDKLCRAFISAALQTDAVKMATVEGSRNMTEQDKSDIGTKIFERSCIGRALLQYSQGSSCIPCLTFYTFSIGRKHTGATPACILCGRNSALKPI